MSLVCHPYATRMYLYAILISLVCTHMSSVCHSYVLVWHLYVTRMYPYITRLWFYHGPKDLKKLSQFIRHETKALPSYYSPVQSQQLKQ